MKKILGGAALALAVIGLAAPVSAETTQWLRKGKDTIRVTTDGGKLYCTRVSDGFEMCHGMTQQADGTWQGPNMKHPDMPGFMTFAGTVVIGASQLSIKGCVLGGICDSEVWTKQ